MTRRLLAALSFFLLASPVLAGDGEYMPPISHEAAKAECSACHLAFPAGFLPKRSWSAIMQGLDNHFGENAELDEAVRADIEAYLLANAADAGGRKSRILRRLPAGETPLRITGLPWFKREHDGEISPRMLAKAKSMANCATCHQGAERGLFEDD